MENTEFLWTDGTNKDFCEFYRITEDFYSSLVGGENKRKSFIPYNASADIPDVLIAYVGGRPVGCAGLKKYSQTQAEIKRVWVQPDARGQHIASRMMDLVERKAKEQGFEQVILQTRLLMKEAVGMYLRRGYKLTENYPPYDKLEGAVCYAKDL